MTQKKYAQVIEIEWSLLAFVSQIKFYIYLSKLVPDFKNSYIFI